MKHLKTFFAAAAAIIVAVSCNKNTDNDFQYPDYYSFVSAEVDGNNVVRFTTDDGRTLIPEQSIGGLVNGQRVVIYFDLINQEDKDKEDAHIKVIFMDKDVIVGNSELVAEASDALAIGNNATSIQYSPNYPQATSKYFNLYVGFPAAKPELHEFTLAYIESEANDSKVLELTLCHNDNGDTSSNDWWTWISLPTNEFADLYAGKEKVRINIKTRLNGIQSVELPIPAVGSEPAPEIKKSKGY